MGTRNAAVRKLGNTRSDDNGSDTNDHGHRRGLFDRERQQPEIGKKVASVVAMFWVRRWVRHHTLLHLSGLVAWNSDLRLVQCGIVRSLRTSGQL